MRRDSLFLSPLHVSATALIHPLVQNYHSRLQKREKFRHQNRSVYTTKTAERWCCYQRSGLNELSRCGGARWWTTSWLLTEQDTELYVTYRGKSKFIFWGWALISCRNVGLRSWIQVSSALWSPVAVAQVKQRKQLMRPIELTLREFTHSRWSTNTTLRDLSCSSVLFDHLRCPSDEHMLMRSTDAFRVSAKLKYVSRVNGMLNS